jgi:hypothetical protein
MFDVSAIPSGIKRGMGGSYDIFYDKLLKVSTKGFNYKDIYFRIGVST